MYGLKQHRYITEHSVPHLWLEYLVNKTATKSGTEAEVDGMNIPVWLQDFVTHKR